MNALRRAWTWFDDRSGITQVSEPIMEHPAPRKVKWMYVFGSATLFSFVLQAVTGIALAFTYVPAAGEAFDSLQFITNEALFGNVLRGIHYFGASSMILCVGVHLIRVFLTGAFKFPRELNWLTGSVLLLLTLGNGLLGQMLRWDQTAVWSAVVAGQQVARVPLIGVALARFFISGEVINGSTLSRFFGLHVFLVPGSIIAVVSVHLYLVVHHGISEPPKVGRRVDPVTYRSWYRDLVKREGTPFWPDIAWRDVAFAVPLILIIVALGLFVGAPAITDPPDPALVDAMPRPDWYLLWYFAILALLPPAIESYVMVGAPLLLVVTLISLPFLANRGERHPARRPWAVLFVIVVVTMIGLLSRVGSQSPWSPDFTAQPLPEQVIGATSGPVYQGGQLFHQRGCEYCHTVDGYGGKRGPNLSTIGDQRGSTQLTIRILNGGINMPAFGSILKPDEVEALVAFLESRRK
jgi:ubiquinol-cytochrome c reductase cytochrome b subunit